MIICKKCGSNRFPKWREVGKMTVYLCEKCGNIVDQNHFVVEDTVHD